MGKAEALIVSLGRHAAGSPAASRACAMGRSLGPLSRHGSAGGKRLVEGFEGARRRLSAVLKIDAVLARQAGEGDPELAQLGGGKLEGGGGASMRGVTAL
jgi:hypothetical protein